MFPECRKQDRVASSGSIAKEGGKYFSSFCRNVPRRRGFLKLSAINCCITNDPQTQWLYESSNDLLSPIIVRVENLHSSVACLAIRVARLWG